MTMNNVSIKDFHVGKPAWSIERKGNTEEIVEQSVINVGRKYVTVLRMERKYSELPGGGAYLTDRASCGYDSWLFPTEQSAKEFIQKKDLILKLRKKIDLISKFGEEYTLADLKKVYEILNSESDSSETTKMIDGITQCCGYDFGMDCFDEKIKFCPCCGRKIKRIN